MTQISNICPRLSRRQDRLVVSLYVYGECKLADIEDDYDCHRDTLREDLEDLAGRGYVSITEETVGGAANPAHVFSLTNRGSEYAHEVSVSDDHESVLGSLDDVERRVVELQAEVSYLRRQTAAQEHYLRQLLDIVEMEGYDIETWSPEDS